MFIISAYCAEESDKLAFKSMIISGIVLEKGSNKDKKAEKSQFKALGQVHPNSNKRSYFSEYRAFETRIDELKSSKNSQNCRHQSHNRMIASKKFEQQQDNDRKHRNQTSEQRYRIDKKIKKRLVYENRANLDYCQKNAKQPNNNVTGALSAEDLHRIQIYFRYYPVSIIAIAGVRQHFMKVVGSGSDYATLQPFGKLPSKKFNAEVWVKLLKNAQLKGKYKYREKFNYLNSRQLKALKYKSREIKRKKSESSSESDDDPKEKCRDMEAWKKSMGVQGKVFIIKGKYPDLREALLSRGWIENPNKKSTFYDLKFTTKINDLNFQSLKPNQIVNHFGNNACLTSKYGIIKSLRSVVYSEELDIDQFFPKSFDMADLGDFENFLEVYKWVYCESLLKRYLLKDQEQPSSEVQISQIKLCIISLERCLCSLQNIISSTLANKFALCSSSEWSYLAGNTQSCDMELIERTVSRISCEQSAELKQLIISVLERLSKREPQFDLNGSQGIWIVKPAFLSRGRGIKCLSDLFSILNHSLGKQTQYVVQKYIENPLIINQRKFDIRIWVLIEDYMPPKIWFYKQFYVRFCLEEYNANTLKNRYAHLTNNSVQKYNSKRGKVDIDASMWDRDTFRNFIEENYGRQQFCTIVSKFKEIVIATVLGTVDQVQGKRGSFELIGYDMMIDDSLNPWLIEINSSPAMDYSTPVTRKLVKTVMEDIAKVVVDVRKRKVKSKTAGQFKCIYNGQGFKSKHYRISYPQSPCQQTKQKIKCKKKVHSELQTIK